MQHTPTRTAMTIAVVATILGGGLVALQSRVNGELGLELEDGFAAALWSFGSGLVILTVAMLVWRPGRRGLANVRADIRDGRMPWWMIIGGLCGGFLVLTQGLTAGVLGVALFNIAVVSGQTASALVLDRRGLGSMLPKPFTVPRLVGTGLALASVAFAVSARVQTDVPFWMLVLPFAAGLAVGWQQAANGQVRISAGSALTATWLNFAFGTTVLAIATLVHTGFAGFPAEWPPHWWLYTGGTMGVVFVAAQSIIVRTTGVLLMGLAIVAGQLTMSVVIDVVFPAPGSTLAASTVIGTVATLVAVLVAAIPGRPLGRGAAVTATRSGPSA
jgi:bacterial/archaeal transporter family-2 protein